MNKIEQAIADIKNGKMVVMVDDEDRENEGDIVFAASLSDMQKVNFAITQAKGVLCLAMDSANAKRLDLPLMVKDNTSSHETAFTITIDAKCVSTGVSAYERDVSIRLAADPLSKADDFVRPGHIFPLIAKNGGVLERTGHTEGSVDLCKLAGVAPMAAICEIVKDDGNMARRDDLIEFCKKFDISMVSVSDLVQYRLKHESLIKIIDKKDVKFAGFSAICQTISDHKDNRHFAFIFGDINKKTNVKFHKITNDIDLFTSNKFNDLFNSAKYLSENSGVLVMMADESSAQNSIKDYGIGAQILKSLDIKEIELLSSSKNREFIALSGFGLDIISYKEI